MSRVLTRQRNLVNYREWVPLEYLSGVYFNKVFAGNPAVLKQPLVIKVEGNLPTIGSGPAFRIEGNYQVVRIILETYQNGVVSSRHSNALIIDHVRRLITRFEPLAGLNSTSVDNALIDLLRPYFRGYEYLPSPFHPQSTFNRGLCVAYTIKYVMDYVNGVPAKDYTDMEILMFAAAVKGLYPASQHEQLSDVEFGGGGLGAGLALGLLGGLAIGGVAAAAASPRTVTTYYY